MKKDVVHKPLKYKNIKEENYLISEYGDIYSLARNKYLKHQKDKDGYIDIPLQNKDGSRGTYRVHVIVNTVFNGKPSSDIIDVTTDHIDGDIENNHYSNLRWLERGINTAIRKNKPIGELSGHNKITERQAIEICERLQNNESVTSIAKSFNISKGIVSSIKTRKSWIHISDKYTFKKKYQMSKLEREEYKKKIFELFKEGYSCVDLIKMGYPETSMRRYYKEYSSTGVK